MQEIPAGGDGGPAGGMPQGLPPGTGGGSNKGQQPAAPGEIDGSLTHFLETGDYDEVDMGSIHQVGQED